MSELKLVGNDPAGGRPVGTLAELQENPFMDPAEIPTCAKPNPAAGIKGCLEYKTCKLLQGMVYDYEFKGDIKGEAGPQYLGCEEVSPLMSNRKKSKMVHSILPCWEIPIKEKNIRLKGGIFRVVATQGEDFDMLATKPEDSFDPVTGTHKRVFKRITRTDPVPTFPRPGDNNDLSNTTFMAEQLLKRSKRDDRERMNELSPPGLRTRVQEGEAGGGAAGKGGAKRG